MGIAVSDWRLARAVARRGQLGVVSGTILAVVLTRRLQLGDPGGHCRRALSHFPLPNLSAEILAEYFLPEGKAPDAPFRALPMPGLQPNPRLNALTIVANFVEVFLAKEGHSGPVGINLLEKIQYPTLPSLYGAMLAGVDYVLMGAGIPRAIPGILDQLATGAPVSLKIDAIAAPGTEPPELQFDPRPYFQNQPPLLRRPYFLAIVSSATLATTLAKKSSGRVDGFVVEGEPAGGHNAPPRGPLQLTPKGEPLYGPRDTPDVEKIRALGLPFWLAGSRASSLKLTDAIAQGATGIQVGTAFAFCRESGIEARHKSEAIALSRRGEMNVFTDPFASPTGFPFKVAELPATLADAALFALRPRLCDLGYLRQTYQRTDGTWGYRCPAEPADAFTQKGGERADTEGRKCLCNGLLATVGLAQTRSDGYVEPPLITAGTDLAQIADFAAPEADSYGADDVIDTILASR